MEGNGNMRQEHIKVYSEENVSFYQQHVSSKARLSIVTARKNDSLKTQQSLKGLEKQEGMAQCQGWLLSWGLA